MALPLSVLADNPRPALVRAKKVKPVTTNGGVLGDHRKLLEELANVEARQKVLSKLLNPYLNKDHFEYACISGNTDLVTEFLDEGMDVNQMTWGHSALHYAALYGHKEMVIMLLKRGADPRLETAGSKRNALQIAAAANEQKHHESKVQKRKRADEKRTFGPIIAILEHCVHICDFKDTEYGLIFEMEANHTLPIGRVEVAETAAEPIPALEAGAEVDGLPTPALASGSSSRSATLTGQKEDAELHAKVDELQEKLETKDAEIAALKAIIVKKKTMSTRGSVTGAMGAANGLSVIQPKSARF